MDAGCPELLEIELERCDFHCRLLPDQKMSLYNFFSASRSSPVPRTQSSILSFCQKRLKQTFHLCSRSSPQTKRLAENDPLTTVTHLQFP